MVREGGSWVMAPPDFFYRLNVTLVVCSGGKWPGITTHRKSEGLWMANPVGWNCNTWGWGGCWENTADWNDLNSSFFFHTCNMKPQLCSWDTNHKSLIRKATISPLFSLLCTSTVPIRCDQVNSNWCSFAGKWYWSPLIKLLTGLQGTTQGMNLKSPYLFLWKN